MKIELIPAANDILLGVQCEASVVMSVEEGTNRKFNLRRFKGQMDSDVALVEVTDILYTDEIPFMDLVLARFNGELAFNG